MKSKDKRSIFDISFFLEGSKGSILDDIEFISAECRQQTGHVLSKNIELHNLCVQKSDIVDLIKSGYKLPAAYEAQKMPVNSDEKTEISDAENQETNSFRMIDLVSKNYNLPKVE